MSIETSFGVLRTKILRFLNERAGACPDQARPIGTLIEALEGADLPWPPPEPLRLPGCRHLKSALAMAEDGPMADLARAFAAFEPHLRWIRTEHYREALGDEYMANYCYANILGYDALIPHDRVIAAFFVIGPGRHYPRYYHEAEEIYFPFGGDTLWSQDDEKPRLRPAGEPIHNTPWLPHEMITQKTPLFTFCFWVSPGPIKLAQLSPAG
ncbi:MAG: hypothetical protein GDA49_04565 [Rhodospirillales bacterium]|nr:hypothetical protein [Rhodospirillales bacterium]